MAKKYSISQYDKYLCLKMSAGMWLILLFLLRPYIILLLSVVNMKDRTGLINMVYPDKLVMSLGALASVPAALLIYAWLKKRPDAHPFVRKLWENGRILLAVSAIFSAPIVFVPLWMKTTHHISSIDWAQFIISGLVVLVVYRSQHIRDCFNDFPKEEDSPE